MADIPSGMDLSKLLSGLMADEKFGEVVNAVKDSLSESTDSSPSLAPVELSQSIPTSDSEESVGAASASSAHSSPSIPQLSPELMAKLPEIMGMLSGGEKKSGSALNDRKRLFHALKPFLSEGRQGAIDSIVSIAGIADIFGL